MDNCTAHGSAIEPLQSDDKQIICYFLPPNVTAILQPMDQGPINITKLRYRNLLLGKVISELNKDNFNGSIVDLLKKHTIKDTIILLEKAWEEVSASILVTSWNTVLRYDDDEFEAEDLVPFSDFMDYSSLIQGLQQLNPNASFTLDAIEQWNNDTLNANEIDQLDVSSESDDDDDDNEESGFVAEQKVTHSSALDCANQLLKWCDENRSTTFVSGLLDLRKEIVDAAKCQPKKQTFLSEYFSIN